MKLASSFVVMLLLLMASTVTGTERFEDKGYHGFVVRLDMGVSSVQPNAPFGPLVDSHKWRSGVALNLAVGLRLGGRVLVMYEQLDYFFEIRDDSWVLTGGDFSVAYYLTRNLYLQAGPSYGKLVHYEDLPGIFDQSIYTVGLGFAATVGCDFPISQRWSLLPCLKFAYLNFDDFESKIVAFSIGIGFMP